MPGIRTTTAVVVAGLVAALAASGCAKRTQTASQVQTPPAPEVAAPAPTPEPEVAPAPTPEPMQAEPPAPPPMAAAPAPTPEPVAPPPPVEERRTRLDPIYFDFDRSEIKPEYQVVLEEHAAWLRRNPNAQ
ncbi:MAG TPA: hypothetical protein VF170_09815, partial [Planctomycetaceae bacterium]